MPLKIACAGCNAVLNVPEEAAGKRVKCPKCQSVLIVPNAGPDFEMVDETPAASPKAKPRPSVVRDEEPKRSRRKDDDDDEPRSKKRRSRDDDEEDDEPRPARRKSRASYDDEDENDEPKAKKRRSRDDDEDDEDDEDTPKRRRKTSSKKKKKGGVNNTTLVVVILLAILLLVGVIGGATFAFSQWNKGSSPQTAGFINRNYPPGWTGFSQPEFEMLVPFEGSEIVEILSFFPPGSPERRSIPPGSKFFTKSIGFGDQALLVLSIPTGQLEQREMARNPNKALDDIVENIFLGKDGVPEQIKSKTAKNLDGHAGRAYIIEQEDGTSIIRAAVVSNRMYFVAVRGKNIDENSELVKMTFDNFKIK